MWQGTRATTKRKREECHKFIHNVSSVMNMWDHKSHVFKNVGRYETEGVVYIVDGFLSRDELLDYDQNGYANGYRPRPPFDESSIFKKLDTIRKSLNGTWALFPSINNRLSGAVASKWHSDGSTSNAFLTVLVYLDLVPRLAPPGFEFPGTEFVEGNCMHPFKDIDSMGYAVVDADQKRLSAMHCKQQVQYKAGRMVAFTGKICHRAMPFYNAPQGSMMGRLVQCRINL